MNAGNQMADVATLASIYRVRFNVGVQVVQHWLLIKRLVQVLG